MVILGALAVSTFALGYQYLSTTSRAREAREAALTLDAGVQEVLATGNPRELELTLPEGYVLKFLDNQIRVNGFIIPEEGYPLPISGPELGAGTHSITIKLENGLISVIQ